ncbi:uncharacterized protein K460DRAFT_365054 [Cucurbitaria berberidis CBS 394.84]|uniref:Uncharacterized protein n=1 Tax=Cucurbitaria berberidis CBS 394.84 TaxID=1168544 RepID=A0A9P4GQ22_9PLEO|nr:uncharacterized protein K460DRAFT_365054 [Cucurbitaria berberidis CBS 394.84]KAF1849145.1 hypothetical protein K460DRAFT_365054 [Cucurbitaria berberidis CBS 394.84]
MTTQRVPNFSNRAEKEARTGTAGVTRTTTKQQQHVNDSTTALPQRPAALSTPYTYLHHITANTQPSLQHETSPNPVAVDEPASASEQTTVRFGLACLTAATHVCILPISTPAQLVYRKRWALNRQSGVSQCVTRRQPQTCQLL